MIVDDDTLVTFLHKTLLLKSGLVAKPVIANDGQQALEYIKNLADPEMALLILLDINMPVMNGWELLDALQLLQNPYRFYVIILTSSVDKADRDQASKYPQVVGYCEKPLNMQTCQHIMEIPAIAPLLLQWKNQG